MDIDEDQLIAVLDKIAADLTLPFLERRGRDHQHKQSPVGATQVEELRDVVNLLNERERELTAAIGIAKMLVAKGKQTYSALEESKEQTETVSRVLRAHQQEIQILREALLTSEEKQTKTSSLLVDAEETISKLNGQSMHYQEHLKTLQKETNRTVEDRDIEEMQAWMVGQRTEFESDAYLEAKERLERDNFSLKAVCEKIDGELKAAKEDISKIRLENTAYTKKNVDLQGKNRALETKLRHIEEEYRFRELDLNLANRKIEHLTEELNSGSPSPMNESLRPPRRLFKRPSFIGVPAFESGSESDSSESSSSVEGEPISEAIYTLSPRGKSGDKHFVFETNVKSLTVNSADSIEIPPVEKEPEVPARRDPGQEYFALVTSTQASQAVKLNSPYMDTICTVPTKELYDKALKNCIPFHKVKDHTVAYMD